ncbi:MAG: TetR/AcrR family transcriptional regulator [Mycobacterium sp.]|nr:TetR/AcrR family transcriptional regulator [Mycobacterium sp.]
MSNSDWRRHGDGDQAVDELLDAAGRAFATFGVARARMVDVARVAGCSRATLYRYFPDQESLHLAYVHRATLRIANQLAADDGAGAPDAIVERILAGIAHVRADPLLAVWFEPENMAVPIAVSQSSTLLQSMSAGLIGELAEAPMEAGELEQRAGWMLRSIVMLLAMPGPDEEAERRMIERFVVPVIATPVRSRV